MRDARRAGSAAAMAAIIRNKTTAPAILTGSFFETPYNMDSTNRESHRATAIPRAMPADTGASDSLTIIRMTSALWRAERHVKADFRGAPAGRVREQAVNPKRAKQQRKRTKHQQEIAEQALLPDLLIAEIERRDFT